ncbi:suppressor protein SRP40 [Hordeum vulgare subsp. vulgare]|uniref:Srp40 C-terminal domain-containing protein n=1 Tax=Hordeum vulgare subsp. vulgare TaxID=112509 RepID=A0A8I6YMZ4_HORVV|nr:suppressor protein SRP40 [Hordeum vulgare subsp. vulgare]
MLFVPRQVSLASLPSTAAAAAAAMAKEEVKKEKKSKSKGAAAKASPAPDARVLAAVAAFLESSGLPLTLAALRSEASLEGDAWRSSPVSLADAVSKLLESSASAPGADITASDGQVKADDAVAEEKGAGKKKKNKKGGLEAHETESKAIEPSAPEKPSEKADDETKEKKRKKKKDSSSAGDDAEANAVVKTDGKKKKSKKQENDEDVEARLEKVELAVKAKFEAAGKLKVDDKKSGEDERKSQSDEANKNVLGDGAPLDKGKKKKKSKSTSETSDKVDAGTAPTEVEVKSNGASENGDAVEGKDVNEKKSKKKKRKSGSEENGLVEDKQVAGKDSAPKSDDENKTAMDVEEGEDGKASADAAVVSKKRKLEEVEGSKPPAKEDITATEDDVKEPSTASKSNKRQKLSEPKSAFQRVKSEDIKFADERLQDNSYWAKGGADSGYGAKAQEILGQVRGRDFRHEKTKKKRGTYKGGFIDLQTHSIKFNNSDDE